MMMNVPTPHYQPPQHFFNTYVYIFYLPPGGGGEGIISPVDLYGNLVRTQQPFATTIYYDDMYIYIHTYIQYIHTYGTYIISSTVALV